MSIDIRLDSPADIQQRIVFAADGEELWELYRQPSGEFGIYSGTSGEVVLKFNADKRPIVSGSWSDGSALRSLFDALVYMQLVVDETTS